MTLKELYKTLTKIEGKKREVSIGNVRELVGIISDLVYEHLDLHELLYKNGKRRKLKKKK